jgi:DNA-binding CsgD family transcriptional regulator
MKAGAVGGVMERLSQNELERLRKFLQETSVPCDLSEFAERALPAINELVRGDVVCHAEADPAAAKLVSQTTYASNGPAPDCRTEFEGLMFEHPVFAHWAVSGDTAAARTSDFVGRIEWHKSDLYQNVYRHWRCEDSLAIGLPAPPGLLACFCIEREKPFTDRERLLMEIVRPHLANSYRTAEAFSLIGQATASSDTQSMLLDWSGRPMMASPGAWELIEHYFPMYTTGDAGLPEALERWVARQLARFLPDREVASLAAPLELRSEGGASLTIRLLRRPALGEQALLVLQEQGNGRLRDAGQIFGLSPREQEVMSAAMRGLDSQSIADALCISRRTVDKHFENIFNKLGVDSRSAAIARVLGPAL